MAETVETIQLVIKADDKESKKALSDLKKSLGKTSEQAEKSKKSFLGLDKSVLKAAAGFASFGLAVRLGREFFQLQSDAEKALTKVATLADFTTEQIGAMRAGTIELQRQFGISFSEISKARFDVVSSGFQSIAEQQELLSKSFTLGVGNATDIAVATGALTGTLKAFSLGASDANRVMDELTAIAQGSKTNLEGLATAIASVAPSAVQAGQSLAVAGGALDVLTLAGISADESATSLRGAMDTLITPAAQKRFEDAKIQIKDIETGAMLPLTQVIENMKDLTPEALRTLIPDKRAARGFAVLIENAQAFQAAADKIASEDSIGGTARAAAKAMATLDAKSKILNETFNSLFQEGTFFGDQMKISVEGLTAELLFLRRVVGDTDKTLEESTNKNTKAKGIEIQLQKDIEFAARQVAAVQKNLDAAFGVGAENRQRSLDFIADKEKVLIGLRTQLLQIQKETNTEEKLSESGRLAAREPSGPLGPEVPPEILAAQKAARAAEESRLDVEELITKIKSDGVEDRLILINNEFDKDIQKAIELGSAQEQLARIEVLRTSALASARTEIRNKELADAQKIRDEEFAAIEKSEADALKLKEAAFASALAGEEGLLVKLGAERSVAAEQLKAAQEDQAEIQALINEGLLSEVAGQRLLQEILVEKLEIELILAELAAARDEEGAAEEVERLEGALESLSEKTELWKDAASQLGQTFSNELAGGITDVFAAIGAGNKINFKALSGKMLQALGSNAISMGTTALLAALIPAPWLWGQTGGPAAIGPAAALIASGAALTTTGAALSKSGGGGGVGAKGSAAGEDVVTAERRRNRQALDSAAATGGGPTIINNIRLVGGATRPEIDILADLNTSILRRQFDNQEINVNNETISGQ